jgi:hypothetical protein
MTGCFFPFVSSVASLIGTSSLLPSSMLFGFKGTTGLLGGLGADTCGVAAAVVLAVHSMDITSCVCPRFCYFRPSSVPDWISPGPDEGVSGVIGFLLLVVSKIGGFIDELLFLVIILVTLSLFLATICIFDASPGVILFIGIYLPLIVIKGDSFFSSSSTILVSNSFLANSFFGTFEDPSASTADWVFNLLATSKTSVLSGMGRDFWCCTSVGEGAIIGILESSLVAFFWLSPRRGGQFNSLYSPVLFSGVGPGVYYWSIWASSAPILFTKRGISSTLLVIAVNDDFDNFASSPALLAVTTTIYILSYGIWRLFVDDALGACISG